jgi:hypothetical protein
MLFPNTFVDKSQDRGSTTHSSLLRQVPAAALAQLEYIVWNANRILEHVVDPSLIVQSRSPS